MDPISNVDRIALLLRKKLLERARANGGTRTSSRQAGEAAGSTGLVGALAAREDVAERVLRRAVVQKILVEQFGDDLVNAAQFQQTIERVTDAIAADSEASQILAQAIDALKSK